MNNIDYLVTVAVVKEMRYFRLQVNSRLLKLMCWKRETLTDWQQSVVMAGSEFLRKVLWAVTGMHWLIFIKSGPKQTNPVKRQQGCRSRECCIVENLTLPPVFHCQMSKSLQHCFEIKLLSLSASLTLWLLGKSPCLVWRLFTAMVFLLVTSDVPTMAFISAKLLVTDTSAIQMEEW